MRSGDIVGYLDMCQHVGTQLQRGMNFRLHGHRSVFLMSVRKNAPYQDQIQDDGKMLIYEGHDTPRSEEAKAPKTMDQPLKTPAGSLTQNGLFFRAAEEFKSHGAAPETIEVFEKIKDGIWVFNGSFHLVDAWIVSDGVRNVCKFRLELQEVDSSKSIGAQPSHELPHDRVIPPAVKLEVWKRDRGKCVQCGATTNLHFDHILPFSLGGSSLTSTNIQLLCVKHNLAKSDRLDL